MVTSNTYWNQIQFCSNSPLICFFLKFYWLVRLHEIQIKKKSVNNSAQQAQTSLSLSNLMASKLDQHMCSRFYEDPINSICVIIQANKQADKRP